MSTQDSVAGASGTSASGVSASDASASAAGTAATGVTVLVSTSIHPLSGRPCTSRNDTLALEIARQLAGDSPRTLHVGDPQDAALPDYLAFGARCVEVLPGAPGTDIVAALAEHTRSAKLILCGARAQSGEASGMLPYLLAAALKRPILADVLEIKLVGDSAQVTQFLPKGRRRTVTVSLPAIIAVHPLATALPRYAYARRVAGRIETLAATGTTGASNTAAANTASPAAQPPSPAPSASSASATSVAPPSGAALSATPATPAPDAAPAPASPTSSWTFETTDRVPVKLKAPDRRSGHARMLAATGSASRGGQVVNEGSNVEKAQAVLDYLREHDLIAFQDVTP